MGYLSRIKRFAEGGRTYTPLSNQNDYFSYGSRPEHSFFAGKTEAAPIVHTNDPTGTGPHVQGTGGTNWGNVAAGVGQLGKTVALAGDVLQGAGIDNAFTQGMEKYGNAVANPIKTAVDWYRGTGIFGPDDASYGVDAMDKLLAEKGIGQVEGSIPSTAGTEGGGSLGKALGTAGSLYSIYSGLDRGGVEGYGSAAQSAGQLAGSLGLIDTGVASAGEGAGAASGAQSGGGLGGILGLYEGIKSLGTKEGKAAGAMSGASAGMKVAGPWGALVGGILGYAAEGGTEDMAPWDAAGFSGTTMDEARKDQNLARLGSNPAGAIASSFGVKSDSTLGKILDPAAVFQKHGDEKRNMKAFAQAFPGIKDLGHDKWALPDGKEVDGKTLQWLAGTWYGAQYHPDGDQSGWQQKFNDALKGVYGAAHGGRTSSPLDTALSTGSRYVKGPGTGRSDEIPARLSDGEYVMDAETVALLGDGSSDAGARRLDELRENIRKHKGRKLVKGKFSDNAKSPGRYLTRGK